MMKQRGGSICGKRKEEVEGSGASKKEEAESKEEETEKQKKDKEEKKEKELLIAKRDEKTLASVWELLMNSKAHREALVLALDHKKLPTSISPE